ncbi:MAG: hypothetical protein AAFN77_10560 [Planctomycetota bacterium]
MNIRSFLLVTMLGWGISGILFVPKTTLGQSTKAHSILEYTDGTRPPSRTAKPKVRSQSNGDLPNNTPAPVLVGPTPSYQPPILAGPISTTQQKPIGPIPQKLTALEPTDASDDLNRLVTQLVLDSIPHTFVEDKDWGKQASRWDGVSIRREGLRLKTKRKTKAVNHGTWKKYSVELVDPKKTFSIEIKQLESLADEKVGFEIHALAELNVDARQSKWVKGVQLYSLSANGHARVALKLDIELTMATDAQKFPPDLLLQPVVKDAELEIEEFRIDRVSKAGGEFAQQVSKAARSELDQRIEREEAKLVEKANKKISEKQDSLRISFSEALESEWFKTAKEVLPASIKSSIR